MAATSLSQTQAHLRNSTLSGTGCSGGQPIVSTIPPVALCIRKPDCHPFPQYARTAVGQLRFAWSAPLRNSILPPPGFPSLFPPGTRDVLRMIIVFSSRTLPKPSTLLHGPVPRLILPSTCLLTPCATKFPTSLRRSLSSRLPRLISYHSHCQENPPPPPKPLELLCYSHLSPTGCVQVRRCPSLTCTVPASLLTPLLAFHGLYAAAFIRCRQVPATLLLMSPGGTETLAPSACSVRKTMSPSNMRFSSVPLRSSLASPISQVWMTLALTLLSGTRSPSLEGWLRISTLPAQVFLQPCCAFEPVLLLLSRGRTQVVLNILNSLARLWPSRYSYFYLP